MKYLAVLNIGFIGILKFTDILGRANKMQKKLKTKKRLESNEVILISVCEMELSRRGVYSRCKPFVEMDVYKKDSYEVVAERAAKKCHLTLPLFCYFPTF